MKVLFVAGGNSSHFEIPPIIEAQANSLKKNGVEIEYFLIKGKGIIGYLKNIKKLKKYLKKKQNRHNTRSLFIFRSYSKFSN